MTSLAKFIDHIEQTVALFLETCEYDDKYDFKIEMNGQSVRIPLNADNYEELIHALNCIHEMED